MNRKRKRRFSFGELESEFEAGNESRRLLEDGKDKLSGVDVNCASVTNDEFWAIMMLRFGSIFANDIVSICTVVPVTCGPWRAEIAKELLGLLTPSQSEVIDTALSACLKRALVDPRTNYESVFSRVLDAGKTGISPFAGCLAPPTAVCYNCQGVLQKNNRPVMVTYFTVSGAIPVKKVELRCRNCNINYGITKFGNKEKGYEYYPSLGPAEASDVAYIDRLVMSHFASLR